MPRSTVKYIFEFKVLGGASAFSSRVTGENTAFLILFDYNWTVQRILFGNVADESRSGLTDSNSKFFLYDPFDAPEYTFIEWKNLNREILERIMDYPFSEEDLNTISVDAPRLHKFPNTWTVMF